jgi:mRNA-degrading endonuclease RelE of RelBE toxin-antitoxin system
MSLRSGENAIVIIFSLLLPSDLAQIGAFCDRSLACVALHLKSSTRETIKALPGNIRQRVKRAIQELATHPRPSQSKPLTTSTAEQEIRRLRLDNWRIIYAIRESDRGSSLHQR